MTRAFPAFFALALLLALLGLHPVGQAADDFKLEEGYTLLFNGKDMTGWELGYCPAGSRPNSEKLDGKTVSSDKVFTVVDGLLVASGKHNRAVYTSKEYNRPFHLKFEFRTPTDKTTNNSGLFLRGPQLQIDGTNRAGALTGVFRNVKNFKEGDWNEIDATVGTVSTTTFIDNKPLTNEDVLELAVKEGQRTVKLNGQPIEPLSVRCTMSAEAVCKCNGELVGKMQIPARGTIGLQSEYGKFEFRRVRIKELPPG